MNWLARLKNQEAPKGEPAKPTKPPFVGFVGGVPGAVEKTMAANDPAPTPDPDRYCWPHSTAMNTAEIDRFLARVETLHREGMGLDEAEALADAMVMRDRHRLDDRRSCMECQHFSHRRKTCGNFSSSRVGPELGDLAVMLQRCPAYCG